MKHNTFEPCKDHENGHFNWCLLCENERKFSVIKAQREAINQLELEAESLREQLKWNFIKQQAEKIRGLEKEIRRLRIKTNDPTERIPE